MSSPAPWLRCPNLRNRPRRQSRHRLLRLPLLRRCLRRPLWHRWRRVRVNLPARCRLIPSPPSRRRRNRRRRHPIFRRSTCRRRGFQRPAFRPRAPRLPLDPHRPRPVFMSRRSSQMRLLLPPRRPLHQRRPRLANSPSSSHRSNCRRQHRRPGVFPQLRRPPSRRPPSRPSHPSRPVSRVSSLSSLPRDPSRRICRRRHPSLRHPHRRNQRLNLANSLRLSLPSPSQPLHRPGPAPTTISPGDWPAGPSPRLSVLAPPGRWRRSRRHRRPRVMSPASLPGCSAHFPYRHPSRRHLSRRRWLPTPPIFRRPPRHPPRPAASLPG